MAKKKRTFRVMLTISYTCDTTKTDNPTEAEEIAKDLALNPNFDTICNGVSLNGIGIEEIDF